MPWKISRAAPDDAPALTRLAHRSKASWGYDPADLARWSPDLTFQATDLERYETWRAEADAAVYQLRPDPEDPNRIHLEHFWVDPDRFGKGLGRELFRHASARAAETGARRMEILSDPAAEPFYLRMGARRIGEVSAPIVGNAERVLPRMELELGEVAP